MKVLITYNSVHRGNTEKVAKAMQKTMIELDAEAETFVLDISAQGVILQTTEDENT